MRRRGARVAARVRMVGVISLVGERQAMALLGYGTCRAGGCVAAVACCREANNVKAQWGATWPVEVGGWVHDHYGGRGGTART